MCFVVNRRTTEMGLRQLCPQVLIVRVTNALRRLQRCRMLWTTTTFSARILHCRKVLTTFWTPSRLVAPSGRRQAVRLLRLLWNVIDTRLNYVARMKRMARAATETSASLHTAPLSCEMSPDTPSTRPIFAVRFTRPDSARTALAVTSFTVYTRGRCPSSRRPSYPSTLLTCCCRS